MRILLINWLATPFSNKISTVIKIKNNAEQITCMNGQHSRVIKNGARGRIINSRQPFFFQKEKTVVFPTTVIKYPDATKIELYAHPILFL